VFDSSNLLREESKNHQGKKPSNKTCGISRTNSQVVGTNEGRDQRTHCHLIFGTNPKCIKISHVNCNYGAKLKDTKKRHIIFFKFEVSPTTFPKFWVIHDDPNNVTLHLQQGSVSSTGSNAQGMLQPLARWIPTNQPKLPCPPRNAQPKWKAMVGKNSQRWTAVALNGYNYDSKKTSSNFGSCLLLLMIHLNN